MIRRLVAVVGVAAMLTVAGCGGDVSGTPVAGGQDGGASERPEGTGDEPGFDECAVLEPAEVAEFVGTENMYVTSADVMDLLDGSTSATCQYFPKDVPGMLGMKLSYVAGADPDEFFVPFEKNFDNVLPLEIGDRGAAVGYSADGTSNHFYEVRAIKGTVGLHLFYAFSEGPGGDMPDVENGADKWGAMFTTAFDRLPAELSISDGEPTGACAEIDLDQMTEVLGAELRTARTTEGDDGALDCTFGGGSGVVSITVLTDKEMVPGQSVKPADITNDDIGDGAKVGITEPNPGEQGRLSARANVGDALVAINAPYGDSVRGVTEPRPEDIELVRAIVGAVTGQD
ncbi:DUF3558 family protein [Actinophytocola sediminis]